jgi:transposase
MTLSIHLYRAQRRRIERRLRKTRCRIEALRCRIVLLLHDGESAADVAKVAGCARATVYRTVYRFEDLGEDGLEDRRLFRPPQKATVEVHEKLLGYLDHVPSHFGWQRSSWTLELLVLQLERDLDVRLSPSHVRTIIRRLGCRRGRPRQALRIPVRGRRRVLDEIERLVRRAGPDAEVCYADEADIDLNPRIGYTYIRRGQQPLVLTPGKNVKRYVAGALNSRTGTITYVLGERKNSDLFIALVEALCHRYRRSRVIHLILDNCITHKSNKTLERIAALDGRVRLHFLPPYSPESNVIERLWKQMHDHVTRNHQHRTIDALLHAVERFLVAAQPFPGTQVSTLRLAA